MLVLPGFRVASRFAVDLVYRLIAIMRMRASPWWPTNAHATTYSGIRHFFVLSLCKFVRAGAFIKVRLFSWGIVPIRCWIASRSCMGWSVGCSLRVWLASEHDGQVSQVWQGCHRPQRTLCREEGRDHQESRWRHTGQALWPRSCRRCLPLPSSCYEGYGQEAPEAQVSHKAIRPRRQLQPPHANQVSENLRSKWSLVWALQSVRREILINTLSLSLSPLFAYATLFCDMLALADNFNPLFSLTSPRTYVNTGASLSVCLCIALILFFIYLFHFLFVSVEHVWTHACLRIFPTLSVRIISWESLPSISGADVIFFFHFCVQKWLFHSHWTVKRRMKVMPRRYTITK